MRGLPDGPRTMHHPTLGLLEFEHVTFQASSRADLRVKVYAASPETASKLERFSARPPHENSGEVGVRAPLA